MSLRLLTRYFPKSVINKRLLIWHSVHQLPDLIPGNMLSLLRYVGLTPDSSNLQHLLQSLCAQMCLAQGWVTDSIPLDMKDLQRFFTELLYSIPTDITVILILDAVDQVRSKREAKKKITNFN